MQFIAIDRISTESGDVLPGQTIELTDKQVAILQPMRCIIPDGSRLFHLLDANGNRRPSNRVYALIDNVWHDVGAAHMYHAVELEAGDTLPAIAIEETTTTAIVKRRKPSTEQD